MTGGAIVRRAIVLYPVYTGWTKKVVPTRKGSSNYEQIKNKQVTVLVSNQKARKRFILIL